MAQLMFTESESYEIMALAAGIDQQVAALYAHLAEFGSVVPLRTLGFGEETILYRRLQIARERWEQTEELAKLGAPEPCCSFSPNGHTLTCSEGRAAQRG